MKVNIEVTDKGYTKTITMNDGTEHTQTFIRDGDGFNLTSTHDEIFDDLDISEGLLDSLEDINYELYDMAFALMINTQELPVDHEEAITDDGYRLERGDTYYGVCFTTPMGYKKPSWVVITYTYPQDWDVSDNEIYKDKRTCQIACNSRTVSDLKL